MLNKWLKNLKSNGDNMKFCYVILHYKTASDTIECINSIINTKEKCDIVVVDNASNNGSIETVQAKFHEYHNIYYVLNNKNLGFASGNNTGYKYARDKLHADMIAILNNDIVVPRPIISELIKYFEKEGYYILGPDIYSTSKKYHQNPMKDLLLDKKAINKEIIRYRMLLLLNKIGLYDILQKVKSHNGDEKNTSTFTNEIQKNVCLHGAFIVFSRSFIEKESIAFREGTFLYMEELILWNYCKNKNYSTVYYPNITIFHKEDSATNSTHSTSKEKRNFVFQNMIKSLQLCKLYM